MEIIAPCGRHIVLSSQSRTVPTAGRLILILVRVGTRPRGPGQGRGNLATENIHLVTVTHLISSEHARRLRPVPARLRTLGTRRRPRRPARRIINAYRRTPDRWRLAVGRRDRSIQAGSAHGRLCVGDSGVLAAWGMGDADRIASGRRDNGQRHTVPFRCKLPSLARSPPLYSTEQLYQIQSYERVYSQLLQKPADRQT